jgi:hypothetical protein
MLRNCSNFYNLYLLIIDWLNKNIKIFYG